MQYTFYGYGHRSILATHETTVEFTKESELTEKGDCIVAVNCDFDEKKIKNLLQKYNKLLLTIQVPNSSLIEKFVFDSNKKFSYEKELVIRKSDYLSERTVGINCDRCANDINREIIEKLKRPKQKLIITLEPYYLGLIFDFDDTLEDYYRSKQITHKVIGEYFLKKYHIPVEKTASILNFIDLFYSHKSVRNKPKLLDRRMWLSDLMTKLKIKYKKNELDKVFEMYWKSMTNTSTPMPHTEDTLVFLKEIFFLVIMSDSDGKKEIKLKRIRKTKLLKYFDIIVTSDDTKINKPDRSFYELILHKLKMSKKINILVKDKNSFLSEYLPRFVMMGDKPQVDLQLAKELGMKTIWIKHGAWTEELKKLHSENFSYIDFEIDDVKELKKIAETNF